MQSSLRCGGSPFRLSARSTVVPNKRSESRNLPPDRTVREISYSSTEIPGFTLANRSVRLDLRCTGQDGRKFIVEMQCYSQEHFFRRCVEYAAKVYDSGSLKGETCKAAEKRLAASADENMVLPSDSGNSENFGECVDFGDFVDEADTDCGYSGETYEIPPVYFIGLLNADLLSFRDTELWDDRFVSEYTFREKLSHDVQDETIFLMFVELSRFRKSLDRCSSLIDKWCYALKHVNSMDAMPEEMKTKVFERFFEACEIARFDADTKLKYEKDMMTERDYYNILSSARKEGRAEGLKKGREEGLLEGQAKERISIARTLKSMNMSANAIAKATGLSEAEIALL